MKKKKLIPILLLSILSLIVGTIVLSGKKHIESVTKTIELKIENEKTHNSVDLLTKKLIQTDSILEEKDQIISKQEKSLTSLKSESKKLKSVKLEPVVTEKIIYIHDTIIIKEKKGFFGKKKVTIESRTSIDSTQTLQSSEEDSTTESQHE